MRLTQNKVMLHSELRSGVQTPGAGLTFLIWVGTSKDQKLILVDAAGIHEHRYVLIVDFHIIRPKLFLSSRKLIINNCFEYVDSL